MSKYALVEFLENGERSVAIVPYIWVCGKGVLVAEQIQQVVGDELQTS
jgi:hypothetical protein